MKTSVSSLSPLKSKPTGTGMKENDMDPYSTIIVDDLLQGTNEWRNIQQIIRLTLKALTDVVRTHGEVLRDLERQMPTKASKSELNSQLTQKVSTTEVARMIADIQHANTQKPTFDDVTIMLKDYLLKTDAQYLLSSKVNIDEVRQLIESKTSSAEVKSDLTLLSGRFEDFRNEFLKQIPQFVHQRDLEKITAILQTKADLSDVNEALETKANKNSVANALHRKANKQDVEDALLKKVEMADFQPLLQIINCKVDTAQFDALTEVLDNKADKSDFNYLAQITEKKCDEQEAAVIAAKLEQTENALLARFEQLRQDLDAVHANVASAVARSTVDVQRLDAITHQIAEKISADDLERYNQTLRKEVNHALDRLSQELQDDSLERAKRLQVQVETTQGDVKDFAAKLLDLQKSFHAVKKQIDTGASTSSKQYQTLKSEVRDEVKTELEIVHKGLDELFQKKCDRREVGDVKKSLADALDKKVNLDEVQSALNAVQVDISTRFVEYKEEVKALVRHIESEVHSALAKKIAAADLTPVLASKADVTQVHNLINARFATAQLDTEHARLQIEKVQAQLDQKATARDVEIATLQTKTQLDLFQKDLCLRASIKDVCTLLDSKANIDDVNRALGDVNKELELKANHEDLNNVVTDQAIINESLCTENIVGRWNWKSGQLVQGGLVPWESQIVNTLPDNFVWEREKQAVITCVAPGLYEVCFCFFGGRRPTVSLLLNGEIVFSASQNALPGAIMNTGGGTKDYTQTSSSIVRSKSSDNGILGIGAREFIVLPPRSRLSILYEGESGAEGFFGIKRM